MSAALAFSPAKRLSRLKKRDPCSRPHRREHSMPDRPSRRDFLVKAGSVGLAGTAIAGVAGTDAVSGQVPAGLRSATPRDLQNLIGDGRRRRILLRGGVVLSLDPRVGD